MDNFRRRPPSAAPVAEGGTPGSLRNGEFVRERKRARLVFNLTSFIYPLVERHLVPRYQEALARLALSRELTVLDVATGSGILAAAFARRGHVVTGLDFSENLLKRAKRRFPGIGFRLFDLANLPRIPARSYGIVSCGYLLHGLSAGFRAAVLENVSRIAAHHVVVCDYGGAGNRFVRLIERLEGPHYSRFISADRVAEFAAAGLAIESSFPTSAVGRVWLCRPDSSV